MHHFSRLSAAMTALCLTACVQAPLADPSGAQATVQDERPNIVVLFVDDLAWMDVGFRSDFIETPNIDRLRSEGISFERAYANAPVCSPSRVGMITGHHPARHDFFRHVGAGDKKAFDSKGHTDREFMLLDEDPAQMPSRTWLPLEVVTIPERLKEVGYNTAFVGKWHIGHDSYHPVDQGFDEQHGVTNAGQPNSYYPNYFRKYDTYSDAPTDQFLTQRLTEDAVSVIDRMAAKEAPFFLSMWWYGVHKPIVGRKDLTAKYEARGIERQQAEYASMVEAVDESVGAIDAALIAAGIRDNTIVVFASDQGGFFARAPLKGRKSDGLALYEGGARVPLFIRWPEKFHPGSSSTGPVSLLDVAPTILQPAGADLSDLDGHNLLAYADGNGTAPTPPVIMYRHYEDLYAAVVDGDWKLLVSLKGDHELYNVVTDISEANNVASAHPERVERHLAMLRAWQSKYSIRKIPAR